MATTETDESAMRQRQRDNWNRSAPIWRERGDRIDPAAITTRLLEMAGIQPGQRVLDLASGAGVPALAIAEAVGPAGSVLGFDLSPGMLDGARALARERGLTNVEFQQIERETELGVPDGAFDAATCRFGLMFMPDQTRALAELRRALRPGARLAVCTWAGADRARYFTLPPEIIGRHVALPPADPLSPTSISLPSHELVVEFFTEAGFQVVETDTVPATLLTAGNPAAWWDARAVTLAGQLSPLPEATRQAIRADAIHTLNALFPEGPVELGADALLTAGVNPG